jgi:hypothetical protein
MIYFHTGSTDVGTAKSHLAWQGGRTCAARPYGRIDRHGYNKIPFGMARGTGMITVTPLVAGQPATFVVTTYNISGTATDGYGFQFHVVAR